MEDNVLVLFTSDSLSLEETLAATEKLKLSAVFLRRRRSAKLYFSLSVEALQQALSAA